MKVWGVPCTKCDIRRSAGRESGQREVVVAALSHSPRIAGLAENAAAKQAGFLAEPVAALSYQEESRHARQTRMVSSTTMMVMLPAVEQILASLMMSKR